MKVLKTIEQAEAAAREWKACRDAEEAAEAVYKKALDRVAEREGPKRDAKVAPLRKDAERLEKQLEQWARMTRHQWKAKSEKVAGVTLGFRSGKVKIEQIKDDAPELVAAHLGDEYVRRRVEIEIQSVLGLALDDAALAEVGLERIEPDEKFYLKG